jgi:hypothetical protein
VRAKGFLNSLAVSGFWMDPTVMGNEEGGTLWLGDKPTQRLYIRKDLKPGSGTFPRGEVFSTVSPQLSTGVACGGVEFARVS